MVSGCLRWGTKRFKTIINLYNETFSWSNSSHLHYFQFLLSLKASAYSLTIEVLESLFYRGVLVVFYFIYYMVNNVHENEMVTFEMTKKCI